jgi:plastocyanin
LQFNFLHRFTRGAPPTRKVVSSPTFLVAAGLPWRSLIGYNYATNSDLTPRYPNEWEFFARHALLAQEGAARVDVGMQAGYNLAARSGDGELSIARWLGPVRVLGAGRYFSDAYGLGKSKGAYAVGGVLRLGRFLAVAGDYASVLSRPAGYDNTWSAALQIAIPYSPHTLSIQATNANTATLQGSSASRDGQRRYGFEFTIPLTLSRYIPHRQSPRPSADITALTPVDSDSVAAAHSAAAQPAPVPNGIAAPPIQPAPVTPQPADSARASISVSPAPVPSARTAPTPPRTSAIARVGMRDMAFRPLRVAIAAGTTVVWTNSDAMVHTVTSDDGRWSSGAIEPGATWRRRFDRPGTYAFHCTPHPFMKGVVVVR